MASFEKRTLKDGTIRWRCKVFAGLDSRGRRRFITSTHGTLKEAKAEAHRLEAEKDQRGLTLPRRSPWRSTSGTGWTT